jgi:preprotein translocase subunit SecG
MEIIVLSIHLVVSICLIGLVLLQRSEGGALGMGGGGGGSLMSGRGAADALAKMTQVAGAFFLATSLGLTFLSGAAASNDGRSVIDLVPGVQQPAATPAPAPAEPAAPDAGRADPTESSAPEAAETQLALIGPADASAAPTAPPPSAAATRAGPIETHPAATTTAVVQRPASTPRTQSAERTQQAAASQRSAGATTTPASTQTQPRQPASVANGAASGSALTDAAPAEAESVDLGNGLEAVRRERAGPDQ